MSGRKKRPVAANSHLYLRIKDEIKGKIASGQYKPGDLLPSESELCQRFNTTRSTVRHALSELVFEDAIIREVGRGSFVATTRLDKFPIDTRECLSFEEQVAMEGKSVAYRNPSLKLVAAPAEVSRDLGVDEGTDVFFLDRLRIIDGRPVCLELRYIHPDIGRHITGDMMLSRSAHKFVSQIVEQQIPTIRVLVSAIIATEEFAEQLSTPVGSALIVRDNWHINDCGHVLMCGKSLFPGDIRTEYFLGKSSGLAKTVIPIEEAKKRGG
ncbi:MAG: GntR family transcriptional regulator [Roseovarius sp.]|uniref:GntR family transcriptional regulator n=1 Tax=Roseovarius sp. TaxID=1486281 RepID=UPI0032EFECAF